MDSVLPEFVFDAPRKVRAEFIPPGQHSRSPPITNLHPVQVTQWKTQVKCLLRDHGVTKPDEAWCADVTSIPMGRGFAYLVMDCHT